MPGIVGLITKMPRQEAEAQLQRMMAALRHESWYRTGTWIDESAGVYVGWVARPRSFSDGMPVCNEDGNVVLVFSGEEYPEPGIVDRLKQRGHTVQSKKAAYLPHLAEDDPKFPAGLNGRFHGLLLDRRSGLATLFNDRYGMERIYYHEANEAFYFAAEAKGILAVRPELRRADQRGFAEFVACGCVLENRTLFEGIYVLPPGSSWSFRNGALNQKSAYFQPRSWEEQEVLEPQAYYRELRETFARNLPRYFNGENRIGMSLTGGLDTRMILAWHQPDPGSLPCYSFGGMLRDSRDVVVARKVAQTCGQPYQVIEVGREFLDRFPHYAERTVYLTDGCAEVARSADLYVNERAAQIAPVRMTGNYGSEVLRHVRAFKVHQPNAGLFHPDLLTQVQTARDTYSRLLSMPALSFSVFAQAPWHHYGLLALEQTQLAVRSPYLDNDLVRTVFRAPQSLLTNGDLCIQLVADGSAALRRIPTDRGLGGDQGRWSSALTRRLLEFSFKAEYAYDSGMPQWAAGIDHLLSPLHLERLFLGAHKFNHYRVWYRDQLSSYVQETLLDSRALSRPYLQGRTLENIVRRHVKGDRNYTGEIHKALTLELISRLFLDPR